MYKKLRKKIITLTMLGVVGLIAGVVAAINITDFVLAAQEGDNITELLSQNDGSNPAPWPFGPGGGPGVMDNISYFIYRESDDTLPKFNMASTDEASAKKWGASLLNAAPLGWTERIYRYRVYSKDNKRYVVVVDQSRELTPAYRILNVSIIVSLVGTAIMFALVFFVSKKLIRPLEVGDNRQRRFIADAARTLKTPVSVISLDNETLKKTNGVSEANRSIDHQVAVLVDLATDLNALADASLIPIEKGSVNLSNILRDTVAQYEGAFRDGGKKLTLNVEPDVLVQSEDGLMRKMLLEIIENALKYSDSYAEISLRQTEGRVELEVINDAGGIPEGSLDQAFNRFYRLDYKDHSAYPGSGVGLSIVQDIVTHHNGRVLAKGEAGRFILKVEM